MHEKISPSNPTPATLLEVISLGSGSCGNALLVRTAEATLLVDCGVGVRRMDRTLAEAGLSLANVDALLLSHEHADHVRELPRFAAAKIPILCTRGTACEAAVSSSLWTEVAVKRPLTINGIEILTIPVSHDAREPCGFLLRATGGTITVLTDLGRASAAAIEAIAESDLVVLEANHDEAMLRHGPYPVHLQRRILSDAGHLSNTACGELLAAALKHSRRLPAVRLAHLSETNNRPHLAIKTVERHLSRVGIRLDVEALPRREASAPWRPGAGKLGQVQLMFDLS